MSQKPAIGVHENIWTTTTTNHHAMTKAPTILVARMNFGVGNTRWYKRRIEIFIAVMLKAYRSEPAYVT